jgi:Winged helix DNA-binding domain
MTHPTLSARALNRAVLGRQMLLERAALPALTAVERLAGMQAQAPNPPYYGLWTRLADFQPAELAQLLLDRAVVRIALQRATIHLVTAADCVEFRPLLQQVQNRAVAPGTPAGRDLAGADLAEIAAAGRALLEAEPRTPAQLGDALRQRWPERDPAMLARAVRALVPVVQVPPRGLWGAAGPPTGTTAEHWLGRPLATVTDRPAALERLVLRYLAAFGPATARDAQAWSGLTGLGAIVDGLRPRLRTFRDEQGRELVDLPDAPRPDPDSPAPARYLPDFDNILIGYADWTRIINAERRRRVFGVNGVIRGTVLLDGFVRGMWRVVQRHPEDPATLQLEPFGSYTAEEEADLRAEGRRLLEFAAPKAAPGDHRGPRFAVSSGSGRPGPRPAGRWSPAGPPSRGSRRRRGRWRRQRRRWRGCSQRSDRHAASPHSRCARSPRSRPTAAPPRSRSSPGRC